MGRKLVINGRAYAANKLADSFFFLRYQLPDSADGPFCFLDRCGKFYRIADRPRTDAECIATVMLPKDFERIDGVYKRTGRIMNDPGSELHPAYWVNNGYVAAEVTLLN